MKLSVYDRCKALEDPYFDTTFRNAQEYCGYYQHALDTITDQEVMLYWRVYDEDKHLDHDELSTLIDWDCPTRIFKI